MSAKKAPPKKQAAKKPTAPKKDGAAKKKPKRPRSDWPKQSNDPGKPLTKQMELFCELVAGGMNQTEAWVEAGFTKNRDAAKVGACRALTRDNVKAMVEKLRQPSRTGRFLTREAKREKLFDMVHNPLMPPEMIIRAMAEDSKLSGDYAPEKREVVVTEIEEIRERGRKVISPFVHRDARPRTPAEI